MSTDEVITTPPDDVTATPTPIRCECGLIVSKKYMKKHLKTQKHTTLMNIMFPSCPPCRP